MSSDSPGADAFDVVIDSDEAGLLGKANEKFFIASDCSSASIIIKEN